MQSGWPPRPPLPRPARRTPSVWIILSMLRLGRIFTFYMSAYYLRACFTALPFFVTAIFFPLQFFTCEYRFYSSFLFTKSLQWWFKKGNSSWWSNFLLSTTLWLNRARSCRRPHSTLQPSLWQLAVKFQYLPKYGISFRLLAEIA